MAFVRRKYDFDQIAYAVITNNKFAFEKLLAVRPVLIDPETNENIFHYACRHANADMFYFMLEKLSKEQVYDLLTSVNSKIESDGERSDGGFLPLDCLLSNLIITDDDKAKIIKKMREIFAEPPVAKPLEAKEANLRAVIEARYPDLDKTSKAYKNLLTAVKICGFVRNVMQFKSWSKPEVINGLSFDEVKELITERKKILPHVSEYKNDETHNSDIVYHCLKVKSSVNCSEYAAAGKHFAKSLGAEIYDTVRGCQFDHADHVILMVGEGADAVACDPWAGMQGEVCLAEDIPKYIRSYRLYDFKFNDENLYIATTIKYNPYFHRLKPYSFHPDEGGDYYYPKPKTTLSGSSMQKSEQKSHAAAIKVGKFRAPVPAVQSSSDLFKKIISPRAFAS